MRYSGIGEVVGDSVRYYDVCRDRERYWKIVGDSVRYYDVCRDR